MDELLQEPEAMDFQLDPMGPPVPPQAMPVAPQAPPMQGNLEQFLQANPNLPRIVRPDNSLIADSYRGIPGAPVPPPQRPDPMQELLSFANRGNRQAQVAYIHLLQRNAQLSHAERLKMQRMQTAIGHITNDPGLMFNEKVNAIRQLQTGVDFYMQREKMAQAKALQEKRQTEIEEMKHRNAFIETMKNADAGERAKLAGRHIVPLPNGGALYFEPGGRTIDIPPAKEVDYRKMYNDAYGNLLSQKMAANKNALPGDPPPSVSSDEVEDYMRGMMKVVGKLQAEQSGTPRPGNPATAPRGDGAANPQAELDAIKRDLASLGIKRAVDAPQDVQAKIAALVAAGAK